MQTKRFALFSLGIAAGAGLMYLLDPQLGRRRRGISRDKAKHFARIGLRAAGTAGHHVLNRVRGRAIQWRSHLTEELVSDDVLVDRVRARLGRIIPHSHAIEVHAAEGRVTLRGKVAVADVARLIAEVTKVPGVRDVDDRIEPHAAQVNEAQALSGRG
jgi:osmotically-inducible protein OsmY